jgi:hypothetical protein
MVLSMRDAHHRQARESTFGGFGLEDGAHH